MSAYFVETPTIDRIITAWRTARAVIGMSEPASSVDCAALGRSSVPPGDARCEG